MPKYNLHFTVGQALFGRMAPECGIHNPKYWCVSQLALVNNFKYWQNMRCIRIHVNFVTFNVKTYFLHVKNIANVHENVKWIILKDSIKALQQQAKSTTFKIIENFVIFTFACLCDWACLRMTCLCVCSMNAISTQNEIFLLVDHYAFVDKKKQDKYCIVYPGNRSHNVWIYNCSSQKLFFIMPISSLSSVHHLLWINAGKLFYLRPSVCASVYVCILKLQNPSLTYSIK